MIFNTLINILFGIYLLYILFYKQPYNYCYHGFFQKRVFHCFWYLHVTIHTKITRRYNVHSNLSFYSLLTVMTILLKILLFYTDGLMKYPVVRSDRILRQQPDAENDTVYYSWFITRLTIIVIVCDFNIEKL